MSASLPLSAILAAALLLAGCAQAGSPSNTVTVTTQTEPSTTSSATTTSTSEQHTTTSTTSAPTPTTSRPVSLEQPAIWPASGVVFTTPDEAAADFVAKVLGVPPVLGEFQQGDSRSGEIEVLSRRESGTGTPLFRSLLLMRQLGPNDGWFVLAAVNDNAAISSPEAGVEVPAGPLTVAGRARGFEATVGVTALRSGEPDAQLDSEVAQGGAMETPEPFSVTLDLSTARPGSTVTILVRGDTGLETDPGEFSAVPVVIAS